MTPAQKAHDTKVFTAAREIVLRLNAAGYELQEVIDAFTDVPLTPKTNASKAVLADAFWVLDNEPGRFSGYTTDWHAKLRNCRNTPEFGKRLFALWR